MFRVLKSLGSDRVSDSTLPFNYTTHTPLPQHENPSFQGGHSKPRQACSVTTLSFHLFSILQTTRKFFSSPSFPGQFQVFFLKILKHSTAIKYWSVVGVQPRSTIPTKKFFQFTSSKLKKKTRYIKIENSILKNGESSTMLDSFDLNRHMHEYTRINKREVRNQIKV